MHVRPARTYTSPAIDTAASYGDSELRLAPWLKHHRDHFFLATKTGERDYDGAMASIERSLERLEVDRLDMIQFHNLTDEPGWRQACVTWLNLLRLKSKPPTIERISPSSGLSEIKAADTSGSCVTVHAPFSSCATRMIAPGRILALGCALAASDGAMKRSAWPSMVATISAQT